MRATTRASVSADAKSLPLASDPIPDADTDQNPDRDSTIRPDPAPISSLDLFPDSNLNQNPDYKEFLNYNV